ncbi:hypothetical protein HW555_012943 [Spodoptera exigua]|uniref:HAT C-terminal dimerisation domain-containing protein n=1 Tax=Spodoptera exigua TaxID=7107 RepID=A0A835L318_SPOEX|nr:hypothetical protein HW555_012943 [Spodoptera exigua]
MVSRRLQGKRREEINNDCDSSSTMREEHLPKKQKQQRDFNENWLTNTTFKNWISKREQECGTITAYCKVCNCTVLNHKPALVKHMNTAKHVQNISSKSQTIPIQQMLKPKPEDELRKRAELKICAFLAHHNLSFSLMDDLIPFLKNTFTDSNTIKSISLGRTKATNTIKTVLGPILTQELIDKLKKTPFSIIMDETTEISRSFASDTTNSMVGEHHSVFSHLKQKVPHIACIKCSCHMIHLVASKACLKLPRSVEDFLRSIGAHFSRSTKRQNKLKEFQDFFGVDIHKILSPATTRWLSLEACVNRTLEQYQVLENLHKEWKKHAFLDFSELNMSPDLPVEEYWNKILKMTDGTGEPMFPNLKEIIKVLLVLPFSNACVERVFSQLKLIKSDQRNRLNTDTIAALMATKAAVKNATTFEPSKALMHAKIKCNTDGDGDGEGRC